MASPLSIGTRILGGAALLLLGVMAIGVAMPATWEARAEGTIDAPPETVFGFLDSPDGWRAWTPWPDSLTMSGPESGEGAVMSWDDEELGNGSFTLTAVEPPNRVRYHVQVGGGKMTTDGEIVLESDGAGTRVVWHEEGDLGRNPLMGFWALSMDRAQTDELEKGVRRLDELVTGVGIERETPADSMSTGASN